MKSSKIGLMAALVAGAVLAYNPALRAEDTNQSKETPKREGRPGRPGFGAGERVNRMSEELKLTAEQKTKVEAVMKEQGEKMRGMRGIAVEERREKMKAMHDDMTKKMKEILTAEQFAKWEKMRQDRGPGGPRGERRGAGAGGGGAGAGGGKK